jgi:hypothetical protein
VFKVLSVPALRLATLIFLFTAKIYDSHKRPDGEMCDLKDIFAVLIVCRRPVNVSVSQIVARD